MSITDDEIEVFYRSNKSRLGTDLKEAREQIREFLRVKKIEAQKNFYLKSLRSNSRIETYLKAPPLFSRGSADYGRAVPRARIRAGDDRQVRGLSMSVLQTGSTDIYGTAFSVQRQDQADAQGPSPRRHSPAGTPGRRGGPMPPMSRANFGVTTMLCMSILRTPVRKI
jgi:hypothetical protein